MKGQSTPIAVAGFAFIIIGIIIVLIGAFTITSPIHSALNQTASSFPTFIMGSLSAAVSGGILVVVGIIFVFIGALVVKHS